MEKQLAAAAPQRQKEILFNAVWPRIVQLLPNETDDERIAVTNEFMNEDNGYILDCIFDPALKILGLSLMNMQLIARTSMLKLSLYKPTKTPLPHLLKSTWPI